MASSRSGCDGRFVRALTPGNSGDFAAVGLVVAVGIALAADFERRGEVDDEEPLAADDFGGFLADGFVGGDERGEDDDAGVVEELGDFGAAAEVFAPLVSR